ncbi:MAG: prepilin-type N-terminal cleavage/methylation domain-containing protein [Hyphomicrobiaceae bacterium]
MTEPLSRTPSGIATPPGSILRKIPSSRRSPGRRHAHEEANAFPKLISPDYPTDAGFTLLELLVSLVLIAMLMVAMPAALHLAKRMQTTASLLDRQATAAATASFIEQRLAEATAIYDRGDDGRLHVIFRGEPGLLAFIAPVTFTTAQSGLARLQFEIGTDTDGRSGLMMTWSLWRPPSTNDQPNTPLVAQSRLLLPAATQFELRYFGAVTALQKPEWSGTWTRLDRIPDMIEFRISNGAALDTHQRSVPLRLRPPYTKPQKY